MLKNQSSHGIGRTPAVARRRRRYHRNSHGGGCIRAKLAKEEEVVVVELACRRWQQQRSWSLQESYNEPSARSSIIPHDSTDHSQRFMLLRLRWRCCVLLYACSTKFGHGSGGCSPSATPVADQRWGVCARNTMVRRYHRCGQDLAA